MEENNKNKIESLHNIILDKQSVLGRSKKHIRIDSAEIKLKQQLNKNTSKKQQNIYDDQDDLPHSVKNIQAVENTQSKKKIVFVTEIPQQNKEDKQKNQIKTAINQHNENATKSVKQVLEDKKPILKKDKSSLSKNNSVNQTPKDKQNINIQPIKIQKQLKQLLKVQSQKQSKKQQNQNNILINEISQKSIQQNYSTNDNDNQFDRYSRKTRQTFRSTRSSCQDYLQHVFNYFCKIRYALDKNPTFDQINQKMNIMGITNFMLFCKQFKIRQKVDRDKLVQVFKKNSSFHRYLTPDQFREAVQQLSHVIFVTYQKQRRFGKMLVFLQVHNSFSFVRRMNDLGISFRMKNKRGIDVNFLKKYQFKLTPNNGKSQQQIALQVKERSELRKILRQQNIQWHKKNKANKIDQLYLRKNKKKQLSRQSQAKNDYNENNKQIKKLKNKQNSQSYNQCKIQTKLNHKYYNPCQILSTRSSTNTYCNINRLKKQSSCFKTNEKYSQISNLPSQKRNYKVNEIITLAKNTILQQSQSNKNIQSKNVGKIKHQPMQIYQNINNSYASDCLFNQNLVESRYIPYNDSILLKKNTQNLARDKLKRTSKQIKKQQYRLQQEIQNISQAIQESNVRPRHFVRAVYHLQKQNTKELKQLQEMIGANNEQHDQLLQQHFSIERKHQQKLSKIQQFY